VLNPERRLSLLYLPDANVLIHALRADSEAHAPCRSWLVKAAEAGDGIGLCELAEAALLRIPTLPKLRLIPIGEVLGFWGEDLWGYPGTRRLCAGRRHNRLFTEFLSALSLAGNDINDAWLAAMAIEHRAILVSTDTGFAKFSGLTWLNPLHDAGRPFTNP
jgi:hypothetical protein